LIDDFLIQFFEWISKRDFITKTEAPNRRRRGKREYLNDSETREFMRGLNNFFESMVEVKRIRNGEHQTLETLINEEALLFAKYLRGENKGWEPRVTMLEITSAFSPFFVK
jgi:hypothetical protein